jgi:signal transduction histidine kinase
MTGIVLAAQAGQLDGTDPPRTFRQIEEAGVRGLDAMDQALRLLRTETGPSSSLADVRAVVDRFDAASTAEVTCELDLPEPRPEVAATVHRVVVESLTNIRRHAPNATSVLVTVTREETDVVVAVTDDGDGDGASSGRGGTGLSGLARQVTTAGGTMTAGPAAPGGWVVRVVVPA